MSHHLRLLLPPRPSHLEAPYQLSGTPAEQADGHRQHVVIMVHHQWKMLGGLQARAMCGMTAAAAA
jgi:hypothetical protein